MRQQLGLGNDPNTAVLNNGRQRHRCGGWRMINRCNVHACRTGRRQCTIRHAVAEIDAGVIVQRRRIVPGAVSVIDQTTLARTDDQSGRVQCISVGVAGMRQQLGLGNKPNTAVLNNGRQRHRCGDWCLITWRLTNRCDVHACRAGSRQCTIRYAVAETDAGIIVQRRCIPPGAVTVTDQGAVARTDGQSGRGQSISVCVASMCQQFGLCNDTHATILSDRGHDYRRRGWCVVNCYLICRCNIHACRAGRRQCTIRHAVAETDAGIIVQRRRITPCAITVIDQGAVARTDRQSCCGQYIAVDVVGMCQQLGLGNDMCTAILSDRRQSYRHGGRGVI